MDWKLFHRVFLVIVVVIRNGGNVCNCLCFQESPGSSYNVTMLHIYTTQKIGIQSEKICVHSNREKM